MVCDRCKTAVRQTLQNLGLNTKNVELGIAVIEGQLDEAKLNEIRKALGDIGFELLEDIHQQTVDRIKSVII